MRAACQHEEVEEPVDPARPDPEPEPVEPSPLEEAISVAASATGEEEAAQAVPEGTPGPPARRRPRIPRSVRVTVSIVLLVFVVEYLVLPEVASARRSLNLLGQVNVGWLVLGVALEVAALVAYAQLTQTVLSPGAPGRFRLLRINMSSLAVSHILPGGTAPGTAVAYRLLGESGVSGSTAAFGLATQGVGSAVVLNAIFWLALLISIPLTGYNPLYGFAAIAGVILLALFAGTVLLLTRGKHAAADTLHHLAERVPLVNPDTVSSLVQKVADRLQILLRDRQLLRHALSWAAANWLLDAASLWVFVLAFGHVVLPIDLLVAYGLANVLAVIPITPGGLGVVEGVLIPTLAGFGVPRAIAILGVLSWRLVNFWLPIPAGGISYVSLRFSPSARRARELRQRPGAGPAMG